MDKQFKGTVKGAHPLAEILSRKLFGISGVPPEYQSKMISKAIVAAVKWHDETIKNMKGKS
jgi:hypothetical protein